MKQTYSMPELEVIWLNGENIVCTSGNETEVMPLMEENNLEL